MDFEIARQMGASCFLICQILKFRPNLNAMDLAIESGLQLNTVRSAVAKLEGAKILKKNIGFIKKARKVYQYTVNQETNWLLH